MAEKYMESNSQQKSISIFLRLKPLLMQDVDRRDKVDWRDQNEINRNQTNKVFSKGSDKSGVKLDNSSKNKGIIRDEDELNSLKLFKKESDTQLIDLKTNKLFNFDFIFDENSFNKEIFERVFSDNFKFLFEGNMLQF